MGKLINDFRLMWTDKQWNLLKLLLLVYFVYKASYQIGVFWAHLSS